MKHLRYYQTYYKDEKNRQRLQLLITNKSYEHVFSTYGICREIQKREADVIKKITPPVKIVNEL